MSAAIQTQTAVARLAGVHAMSQTAIRRAAYVNALMRHDFFDGGARAIAERDRLADERDLLDADFYIWNQYVPMLHRAVLLEDSEAERVREEIVADRACWITAAVLVLSVIAGLHATGVWSGA